MGPGMTLVLRLVFMQKHLGLQHTFYGFRWLTTLLAREFELPETLRLWDSFFADEGRFSFMLHCCATMIILQRGILLQGDFAECLKLLQNYPGIDIRRVLRVAAVVQADDQKECAIAWPAEARRHHVIGSTVKAEQDLDTPGRRTRVRAHIRAGSQLAKRATNAMAVSAAGALRSGASAVRSRVSSLRTRPEAEIDATEGGSSQDTDEPESGSGDDTPVVMGERDAEEGGEEVSPGAGRRNGLVGSPDDSDDGAAETPDGRSRGKRTSEIVSGLSARFKKLWS